MSKFLTKRSPARIALILMLTFALNCAFVFTCSFESYADDSDTSVSVISHSHRGGSSEGGACFGNAVYHVHEGSPDEGTGCYQTPVIHHHNEDCYGACQVSVVSVTAGDPLIQFCTRSEHWAFTNIGTLTVELAHSSCGHSNEITSLYDVCYECFPDKEAYARARLEQSHDNALICHHEDGETIGYELSCGKDETTVEHYEKSCDLEEKEYGSIAFTNTNTGWTGSPVFLTGTFLDPEGVISRDGYGSVTYSTDDGTIDSQSEGGILVSSNGTYKMKVSVNETLFDSADAEVALTVSNIDSTAPEISAVTYDESPVWSKSNLITVTASDYQPDGTAGSGLDGEAYSFDGGVTWQSDNTYAASTSKTVQIRVRDKCGNVSSAQADIENVDDKGPVINVFADPVDWKEGDGPRTFTITAWDEGCGLNVVAYSYDGGITWTNSNHIELDEEGEYEIIVRDGLLNRTSYVINNEYTHEDTSGTGGSDTGSGEGQGHGSTEGGSGTEGGGTDTGSGGSGEPGSTEGGGSGTGGGGTDTGSGGSGEPGSTEGGSGTGGSGSGSGSGGSHNHSVTDDEDKDKEDDKDDNEDKDKEDDENKGEEGDEDKDSGGDKDKEDIEDKDKDKDDTDKKDESEGEKDKDDKSGENKPSKPGKTNRPTGLVVIYDNPITPIFSNDQATQNDTDSGNPSQSSAAGASSTVSGPSAANGDAAKDVNTDKNGKETSSKSTLEEDDPESKTGKTSAADKKKKKTSRNGNTDPSYEDGDSLQDHSRTNRDPGGWVEFGEGSGAYYYSLWNPGAASVDAGILYADPSVLSSAGRSGDTDGDKSSEGSGSEEVMIDQALSDRMAGMLKTVQNKEEVPFYRTKVFKVTASVGGSTLGALIPLGIFLFMYSGVLVYSYDSKKYRFMGIKMVHRSERGRYIDLSREFMEKAYSSKYKLYMGRIYTKMHPDELLHISADKDWISVPVQKYSYVTIRNS